MFKKASQFLITAVLSAIIFLSPANAATILSVEDIGRGSGSTAIGPAQAFDGVAQSFTALRDFTNVAFSFDLRCISCVGELLFMRGVPAIDTPFFARESVTAIDSGTSNIDVVTGIDLKAGTTYSMILTITSGDAIWRASEAPIFDGIGGVTAADSYLRLTDINTNFVPWSPTEERTGATLQFSLTQQIAAVPLPAGVFGLISGLFALGLMRRCQT